MFGSLDEARRFNVVELLRGLHDRFEQVILITHIEPVREGLDRVISVSYDPDQGCSVVTLSEHDGAGLDGERQPFVGDRPSRAQRSGSEDMVKSAEAGAGAGA